ncbi:hypothetical protein R5R35_014770 [Gryllus longicercus]|uniref:E3 ubiquitin-protein ligase n=1 Tax=Gryllus longicercus TaxID=2509291 RepID=A0AAN9Z4P0_9ORTH
MGDSTEQMHVEEETGTLGAVLQRLQCFACRELMSGQQCIELCGGGHSVCGRCRSRAQLCPLCGTHFPGVRNRLAEGIASQFGKCAHPECQHVGLRAGLLAHEVACSFRLIKCMGCAVHVRFLDLKTHYEKEHDGTVVSQVRHSSLLATRNKKFQLIEWSGKYFWFWKHKTNKLMYMGVHAAEKYDEVFKCALKLESKDKSRELSLKLPVHESHEHAEFQGNFLKCRKCSMVTLASAKETNYSVDIMR